MDLSKNKFGALFNKQRKNQFHIAGSNYRERIKKLDKLKHALEYTYKQSLRDAMYADFKKPHLETDLTEIYLVIKEIKYAKAHLRSWLKKHPVDTPLALLGTSSWIHYEPKGVCLIISPWNYPINLTFGPLVSAIAAGNTVILKPSEMTPHTSSVMKQIVEDIFNEDEIALVEGEVEVSQELLKLPFNHIFFTGSPTVGRIVMTAAAKHLSSVTLELGGKSPTIIDESANINAAVENVVWGKYLNNGQTCIAPDYVLIHESQKDKFIKSFKDRVQTFYSENASSSASYSRVVNTKHFKRLVEHILDAKTHGASIDYGGTYDEASNYIEPTLISNLPDNSLLLQEEIFGPILPVKTYKTLDDAIAYVNSKEKPLALYIYSKRKKVIRSVIERTRAGSTAINCNAIQYSNHNLPFGGSNNSGIGKAHGFFGFQEFSNQRSVLRKHIKGPLYLLLPPYNGLKQKLVDMTIKWF